MFQSKPDLLHLRTFGCTCFPLLKPYNKHKLQPHTKPYIFLGYPTYSKGYICLEPNTLRIYISRHVLFNEFEFLFWHNPHQHQLLISWHFFLIFLLQTLLLSLPLALVSVLVLAPIHPLFPHHLSHLSRLLLSYKLLYLLPLHFTPFHHLLYMFLLLLSHCYPLLRLLCLSLYLLRIHIPWLPGLRLAFSSPKLLQPLFQNLHPSVRLTIQLLNLPFIKLLHNFHNGAQLWMTSLLLLLDKAPGPWCHLHHLRML